MAKKVLKGTIDLMKLQHAVMQMPNGSGGTVECIVLPIDSNYIERNQYTKSTGEVVHQLNMAVNVWVNDQPDQYGQDGSIQQNLPTGIYKALGQQAAQTIKLPTLGNLKDFNRTQPTAQPQNYAQNPFGQPQAAPQSPFGQVPPAQTSPSFPPAQPQAQPQQNAFTAAAASENNEPPF